MWVRPPTDLPPRRRLGPRGGGGTLDSRTGRKEGVIPRSTQDTRGTPGTQTGTGRGRKLFEIRGAIPRSSPVRPAIPRVKEATADSEIKEGTGEVINTSRDGRTQKEHWRQGEGDKDLARKSYTETKTESHLDKRKGTEALYDKDKER